MTCLQLVSIIVESLYYVSHELTELYNLHNNFPGLYQLKITINSCHLIHFLCRTPALGPSLPGSSRQDVCGPEVPSPADSTTAAEYAVPVSGRLMVTVSKRSLVVTGCLPKTSVPCSVAFYIGLAVCPQGHYLASFGDRDPGT